MDKQIIFLQKENHELRKKIIKLETLISIDFLTQTYNRRAFSEFLKESCKEIKWLSRHDNYRQQKEQFTLLLIDIDDFKKFNDKFGHLYGDKVLKRVARYLKKSVRGFDIVARWGGEEFAIILREASLPQGTKRAETILENAQKNLPVTFSIGVIHSDPNYSEKEIFNKADKALYRAKKQGKNQVIVVK